MGLALTPAHAAMPASAADAVQTVVLAERQCGGVTTAVRLPERVAAAPGQAGPLRCNYRLTLRHAGQGLGLFIPGLAAHARISINGQVLVDTLAALSTPLPRAADRSVLISIPDAVWQPGPNALTIDAGGPRSLGLSSLQLGPYALVQQRHRAHLLGGVVGPALVAAVVGTLGLCMLLMWAQRRDALYAYFGAGTLGWALHSGWSLLPWPPLPGVYNAVGWTSLYAFFVVMLVAFCLRFADWHWPRFERGLWAVVLGTPPVLMLAVAAGLHDEVDGGVRLLLLLLTATGLAAVLWACLRRASLDRWLILAAGALSLLFGVHDWRLNAASGADNPVYLVPYAGLAFAVVVVRMLVHRFIQAGRQLERLNASLAQQVAGQTAELQQAIVQMRQARDAAQHADQAKTRFLAAASHDLRQPAHALALYMAALRTEPLDQRQADLVLRMSGSLSALETMFNLLLDISRIDAGATPAQPSRIALAPLLRRLADEFAPQVEARGLRLALRLPPTEAAYVDSDPVLLERILRNLLANAAKYTAHGGILLACRLRGQARGQARGPVREKVYGALRGAVPDNASAGPHWRIEVWDSGLGITEAEQAHIFEEFYQVDNPGRDRAQGLGLGLSIVQRLVRLLGLSLRLHSRPGRGSCFALCLPQAPAPAPAPAPAHATPPASLAAAQPVPDLAGLTVGLIEDDAEGRDAMQALLTRWGCRVAAAADADALAAACLGLPAGRPQLLLVDHRLQAGRTGPAEAEALFQRWQQRLPLLVVTGEPDWQALRNAGHDCLPKPLAPALLARWLAQAGRELSAVYPQHRPKDACRRPRHADPDRR